MKLGLVVHARRRCIDFKLVVAAIKHVVILLIMTINAFELFFDHVVGVNVFWFGLIVHVHRQHLAG